MQDRREPVGRLRRPFRNSYRRRAAGRRRGIVSLAGIALILASQAVFGATSKLQLSEGEGAWLEAHPKIRLAVDIDWLPFEHVDEARQYRGMAAEYIALVGEKLGIEFEVEKDKPWSQAVDAVKARELDMFSCVVATPQRREYVDFTKPYLSFPMVIVTSDNVAYVTGMRELRNETVAVVRGYATQDLLEKNHPELDLYLADNVADALQQVSHGKVYAYIGNIATVSHVIRREGLTNVKVSGETPYLYELSMAVRNDWPEFVPILQKALNSITEQERDQIFHNWIKLRYEYGFDYALMGKVLAALLLVLATILYWNRRLSREVGRRVAAETLVEEARTRLEEANHELQGYVDIVDRYVITSAVDADGRLVAASDALCAMSGYGRDELIGSNHRAVLHADMPESLPVELWQAIVRGASWQGEIKHRKKGGGHYWVQANVSPKRDERGEVAGYTAIFQDITGKRLAEELSITDELTQLFNRRHFNRLLPLELARAARDRRCFGLMLIDVDYFKQYNDSYGHLRGDVVLQAVAGAIGENLKRAGDFAFRVGGEEFAVIVTVDNAVGVVEIAESLRLAIEALNLEHASSDVADRVTVSIGVKYERFDDGPAVDAERLYRLADEALYVAKENGRNRVEVHESITGLVQAEVR